MHTPDENEQLSLSELAERVEKDADLVSPEEAAEAIRRADTLVRRSQVQLHRKVRAARGSGISWQSIGDALGVSRQAAFKRFGGSGAEHDDERHTMSEHTINLLDRTEQVFERLNADDYESVRAHMTYTCARALNKRKVMRVWNEVTAATGQLETCADTIVQTPDGTSALGKFANRHLINGAVVQTTLQHEAGEWIGRVAYNSSGKITGLLIAPVGSENLPF